MGVEGAEEGDAEEVRLLKKENKELKDDIARLEQQLARMGNVKAERPRTPPREPVVKEKAPAGRRSSLDKEKPLLEAKKPAAKKPAAAAPKGGGKPQAAKGDRIQDMGLPLPVGADDGPASYKKLQEAWLKGPRTASGKPLDVPDDEEYGIDELMLSERPKKLKHPVPLKSLITALADQWMADNTL